MELPQDPAIPLLGEDTEAWTVESQKAIRTPRFMATLFTTAQGWRQPKCPPVGAGYGHTME